MTAKYRADLIAEMTSTLASASNITAAELRSVLTNFADSLRSAPTVEGEIVYDAVEFHPGTTDPFPEWGQGGLGFLPDPVPWPESGDDPLDEKAATGLRLPSDWDALTLTMFGFSLFGSGNVRWQVDINGAVMDPVDVECAAFTPFEVEIATEVELIRDFPDPFPPNTALLGDVGSSGFRFGNLAIYRLTGGLHAGGDIPSVPPDDHMDDEAFLWWVTATRVD